MNATSQTKFTAYLADLEAALSRLRPEQRQDALREIESHFADATAAGSAPEEVLARLGPPRLLGAALVADGLGQSGDAAPLRVWRVVGTAFFVAGTSLTSLLLVPFLTVIAAGFGVIAVISPVAGIVRTLGGSWIQIDVGPGRTLPIEWSVPFMLGVAVLSAGVAFGAYRLLRLYLAIVGRGYRAVLAPRPQTAPA